MKVRRNMANLLKDFKKKSVKEGDGRSQAELTTPKLLKQFKKTAAIAAKKSNTDIDVGKLTVDMVRNMDKITVLKVWAKDLDIPNLNSYKSINIKALQSEIIQKIVSRESETMIRLDSGESDGDFYRQYQAIENFLNVFYKRQDREVSIFGVKGIEFKALWDEMTNTERRLFSQDFFTLNINPKVNPIDYLRQFLASKEIRETPLDIALNYLRAFINYTEGTPDGEGAPDKDGEKLQELQRIEEHVLFSQDFANRFRSIPEDKQLEFAHFYVQNHKGRQPLEVLNLFLRQSKIIHYEKLPTGKLFLGGNHIRLQKIQERAQAERENNYQKCVVSLRQRQWEIQPIGERNVYYLGDRVPGGSGEWYNPTELFFTDLCKYHSYVKSPKENLLILNSNTEKYSFLVRKKSSEEYSPTDLQKDLISAQKGSIFVKLSPVWIASSPLYQVDPIYLNTVTQTLTAKSEINFDKIISDLQKSSRYETFETYLFRFLLLFFPFFENISLKKGEFPYANYKNSTVVYGGDSKKFFITEQVKNGYLTPEAYFGLTIAEKVPEVNEKNLIMSLERYLDIFIYESIKGAGEQYIRLTPIEHTSDVFEDFVCPEEEDWQPQDLIVHEGRCFVLPQLLSKFKQRDFINQHTGKPFEQEFIDGVSRRYDHLMSNKFQKKGGEVVYIDQNLHDIAHPVEIRASRGQKYSDHEISQQFNEYFRIKQIILDPAALIKNIISFDPKTKCAHCQTDVDGKGVKSVIDRTDGNIVQLSFCDYTCMLDHNFLPVHSVEELGDSGEPDTRLTVANIVEKV